MGSPLDQPVPHPWGLKPVLDEQGRHKTDEDGKPLYHVSSALALPVETTKVVASTAAIPFESVVDRLIQLSPAEVAELYDVFRGTIDRDLIDARIAATVPRARGILDELSGWTLFEKVSVILSALTVILAVLAIARPAEAPPAPQPNITNVNVEIQPGASDEEIRREVNRILDERLSPSAIPPDAR